MLSFDELRAREFARLDAQQHAYLDYTGSALYGDSQLRAHDLLLRSGIFGNPHSDSAPSRAMTERIESVRNRVLQFFDADDHEVIFTANTSAAIRLVAESYPFTPKTALVLSTDNHNSVNGIREYAARAGATVHYLPLDNELRIASLDHSGPGLFAFPAQSNFSGVLHPLSLVDEAQTRGFDVLIDAAAYVPSHALSLRQCPAQFTVLSFYKLFGYPTGIGALIARRDALSRLRRPWFSGGTVLYASTESFRLRDGHEAFEDGTPNFLGIAALDSGFDLLERVEMPRLTAHVEQLTAMLLDGLLSMPHVRLYGPAHMGARGGTIAFNVRNVPYWDVEACAREAGVSFRGGCFCNPGASEVAFDIDRDRARRCLQSLGSRFTPARFAQCVGTQVGAVRASVGLANNEDDVQRALNVIAKFS